MKKLSNLEQFRMDSQASNEIVGGRGNGRRKRRGDRRKAETQENILLPVEEIIICELPAEVPICEFSPEIIVCELPAEMAIFEG